MEQCRWCGLNKIEHTAKQWQAGLDMFRILGPDHAYNAKPWPKVDNKLSKSNEV